MRGCRARTITVRFVVLDDNLGEAVQGGDASQVTRVQLSQPDRMADERDQAHTSRRFAATFAQLVERLDALGAKPVLGMIPDITGIGVLLNGTS